MKTSDTTGPVAASKRHNASPVASKRPHHVHKLVPLVPHNTEKLLPPPPSPIKPHVNILTHLRTEVDRLRNLMGVAVGARDLKQVEAIMEQLLSLVERGDSRDPKKRSDAERQFDAELLAYLDVCEADLKALVQQEERERKHQRLVANALMQQATGVLRSSAATGLDERAVQELLDKAEHAYRRARDKRADCIPAIRHRVAAEVKLHQATRLFDGGDISAAIETARSASDQYAAFRASPSYQGSQILLSLSGPSDAWEQAPLRDLGRSHDDLDRCFANVDDYFADKVRGQTKTLLTDSKRLADEKRFVEAREAMKRCDAVYAWLVEPTPLAVTKWKRQLARLQINHELQRLETATQRAEITGQLATWGFECDAGNVQREDLVECGVAAYMLKVMAGVSVSLVDSSTSELASAVFTLLFQHIAPSDASSGSLMRQLADVKTVVAALLQLVESLESDSSRVRVLKELASQLDGKQSVHVAIHKCDCLARWARLRDAHSATPNVLVALLEVLHRLIVPAFPACATVLVASHAVRGVVSTMARHYKHVGVASACLEVFSTLCTARDHCVGVLLPSGDIGLSSATTHILRHYTQQPLPPTPQITALVGGLIRVVSTLSELDLAFAKAIDAVKIPALVVSLGANPPWGIPPEVVAFFEPREFSRSIRDGQLPKRASTRTLVSTSVLEPPVGFSNPQDAPRSCLVRFGVSVEVARRRQFCVVRFLVPNDSACRADQCRLEVTGLQARTQRQVYAFPRDGVYSLALLRRELTRATPARTELFRALVASLQPIATNTRRASDRNTLKV